MKIKKFLRKKVFKAIPVWAVMLFMFAGICLGVWLRQTRMKENVLSVKSQTIMISEDGVTWTKDLTGFIVEELTSEAGNYVTRTYYLKSSESPPNGIDFSIQNLQRFNINGDLVEKPADPLKDITMYFELFDVQSNYEPVGRIGMGFLGNLAISEGGSHYSGSWFDDDQDGVSNEMGILIDFVSAGITEQEELEGAYFSFDIVMDATP